MKQEVVCKFSCVAPEIFLDFIKKSTHTSHNLQVCSGHSLSVGKQWDREMMKPSSGRKIHLGTTVYKGEVFFLGKRGTMVNSSYLCAAYWYILPTVTFNGKPLALVLMHAYTSLILPHHGTTSSISWHTDVRFPNNMCILVNSTINSSFSLVQSLVWITKRWPSLSLEI